MWPAGSPDITPLDFFLWGYVKANVFRTPMECVGELKEKIREAVDSVRAEMLANTWRELRVLLVKLLEDEGGHVEI